MRTLTRDALVGEVRREVLKLVDPEHSFCDVAARLGIGCLGFRHFSDEDLARRYRWIVRRRDPSTREELEDLANRWQLARQIVQDRPIACDVQAIERDTCAGWDVYSDAELLKFHHRLTGETVRLAERREKERTA